MRALTSLILFVAASALAGTVIVRGPLGGGRCASVGISVPGGGALTCPQTVSVSTSTTGAVIFYTLGNSASDPTHTGSTATGSTVKINATSGSFSSGGSGSATKYVRALAYRSDLADSAITAQEPVCGP